MRLRRAANARAIIPPIIKREPITIKTITPTGIVAVEATFKAAANPGLTNVNIKKINKIDLIIVFIIKLD